MNCHCGQPVSILAPPLYREMGVCSPACAVEAWRASQVAKRANVADGDRAKGKHPRKAERCPCGQNTLRRAKARAYDCCKRAGVLMEKEVHV